MCTDYDIWYSCGHKGHSARPENVAGKARAGLSEDERGTPTARVTKHCTSFQETGKLCPAVNRLVISQVWDMKCEGGDCSGALMKVEDPSSQFLQKLDQEILKQGSEFAKSTTEKRKQELRRMEARLCQPQVWGRKGPHIKRTRNSKTREEREREKREKLEATGDGEDKLEEDEEEMATSRSDADSEIVSTNQSLAETNPTRPAPIQPLIPEPNSGTASRKKPKKKVSPKKRDDSSELSHVGIGKTGTESSTSSMSTNLKTKKGLNE